jgi:hypothetical protein
VSVQIWQYDRLMSIDEKRMLYGDSILSGSYGNWPNSKHPYRIAGMEGILAKLTPPDRRDIRLGSYCRAQLRDDHVYLGSYWPDESQQGPIMRNFSVWCTVISTYPWEGGAKNILDSFEIRSTT